MQVVVYKYIKVVVEGISALIVYKFEIFSYNNYINYQGKKKEHEHKHYNKEQKHVI
jgi:hypothetical protein